MSAAGGGGKPTTVIVLQSPLVVVNDAETHALSLSCHQDRSPLCPVTLAETPVSSLLTVGQSVPGPVRMLIDLFAVAIQSSAATSAVGRGGRVASTVATASTVGVVGTPEGRVQANAESTNINPAAKL